MRAEATLLLKAYMHAEASLLLMTSMRAKATLLLKAYMHAEASLLLKP